MLTDLEPVDVSGLAVAVAAMCHRLIVDEAWQRDALCIEHPEVEFFVERGGDAAPAKAVCGRCLVRRECLGYAVAENIREGIWGGTTGVERRKLRSARAA